MTQMITSITDFAFGGFYYQFKRTGKQIYAANNDNKQKSKTHW